MTDPDVKKRVHMLRRLEDYDGLHGLVGDAIISFIKNKRAPFPGALLSREHFLRYATWKMAFIFVKLMRELTCTHANKHWNKFGYGNYKLNKRCFHFFCEKGSSIWEKSPLFMKLPAVLKEPEPASTPVKQRTRKRFELSSPEGKTRTGKRAKIVCLLSDSDDDE